MKFRNVSGVKNYNVEESLKRKLTINEITSWLELWGYKYIEVPSIINSDLVKKAVEGTENRIFELSNSSCLIPEVTKYIVELGAQSIGSNKIYYVAKCFRNETTTDSERLKEFTQIGVEILKENNLDARKEVRYDAIKLFTKTFGTMTGWKLFDGCERGLNLYNDASKTFEIRSEEANKQILGGGAYDGGAGWALGLERLEKLLK